MDERWQDKTLKYILTKRKVPMGYLPLSETDCRISYRKKNFTENVPNDEVIPRSKLGGWFLIEI